MTGGERSRRTDPARRGSGTSRGRENGGVQGDADITLHGMRFHALIGVLEHERTIPQPLEVDLTVRCRPGPGVVDYRRLYELVRAAVESGPTDYLEELAERIARDILADARVDRTRVAVRKPHVALPGPLAYAEVAILRRNDR